MTISANFRLCQPRSLCFYLACQCSGVGSNGPECDSSGRCSCRPQYSGFKCEHCATGYYDYPRCIACTCDRQGSLNDHCNPETGQCPCKENFSGTFCSRCKAGFYGFPDCQECGCDPAGVKPLPGIPLGDCSSSNTVCSSSNLITITILRRFWLLTPLVQSFIFLSWEAEAWLKRKLSIYDIHGEKKSNLQ